MATTKSLAALEKSKEAIIVIKQRLAPVLRRLTDDTFGEETGRAQASVALSIGMMRYMGARLRGLDRGKKSDDPLRKELNNIKRILAKTIKSSKGSGAKKKPMAQSAKSSSNNQHAAKRTEVQPKIEEGKASQHEKCTEKKKRKTKTIADGAGKSPRSASKKARQK